jgi:uncharacterized membrane protein YdjX (TVP38/TMEM64 family)
MLPGIRCALRSALFWQLATLLLVGGGIRYWMDAQDDIGVTVAGWGLAAPLLIVALQGALATTPFGTSVLPVLNGALFPLILAVTFNVAGGAVGGTLLYFVWRRGEKDLRLSRRLDALPARVRRLVRADLRSLILMRALPWAGGNLATLVAGTARVPFRIHLVAMLIGSVPGSIIYALIGAGIVAL